MSDPSREQLLKRVAEQSATPFQPAGAEGPSAVKAEEGGQHASGRCPKCRSIVSEDSKECPTCKTILFLDSPPVEDRLRKIRGYNLAQLLFREPEYLFEAVFNEEGLNHKLTYYAACAFLFSAIYGAFLGMYSGWLYIPTVAGKFPLLLFGTLVVCAPALFTFNVLLGSKLTVTQTLAMLVVATYLISAVLVSLAPIVLFFIISGSGDSFILLLNVACCAIAGD